MRRRARSQAGQVLVLVAVALLALIGSAALVLLAGSAEWQKNQLQTLADSTALDSALKIGIGCNAASASTVITEADNFLATQRTRTGALAIAAGTCATPYVGTDTFAGGLSATYDYPYKKHQQQVEVTLTLNLPISFGGEVGKASTTVSRYAVAEALPASVPAVSAGTLSCPGGQVNVAGDILAQSAVTLSGGCALYAHQRLSGGAYSSLGNVRVYTDAQAWTGVGGSCTAGANTGSTNAICADGYELSGHTAPTCGGATQYLSAANLLVNASPCAAGVGRQPVAPISTVTPPAPNTDPAAIATLQGTGGAACTPGGAYPNIVVGGSTVGTGLAPAPIKDASGFYHFKPSCYGYLNPAALAGGGAISNVQVGPVVGPSRSTVSPTLAPSQVGTLLVATLRSDTNPSNKPFTGPAGWVSALAGGAFQDGAAHVEIWYYPNNPGGITIANFGVNPASIDAVAQISEWSGVATVSPLERTGIATFAAATATATVSTSAATTVANELVITDIGFSNQQSPNTYTPGAGWNTMVPGSGNFYASDYRQNLPAAVASETVTGSQATTWALAIATFKPAGGGGGGGVGAVLDPGFYYFNGSGFPGGGGICLNGGTMLARDVTLEFVNQAGFSSGTCAAGGGAGCASGTCRFGSDPALAPTDIVYTWFAAPCSKDPTASPDVSCRGASSWCPVGDRSCWDLLVWAPAGVTGQISIKGTAAQHWLLGSVDFPGAFTDTVNGSSTIAGTVACGSLSISAAAGAGIAIGGDYGINTAPAEATLVE